MSRFDSTLSLGTASVGLGGAFIAQITQSPEVTLGAIALAVIGLLSLWVRSHYALAAQHLDTERLRTEIEVYRALCTKQKRCPFSADGRPACAEADQIEATRTSGCETKNNESFEY